MRVVYSGALPPAGAAEIEAPADVSMREKQHLTGVIIIRRCNPLPVRLDVIV